MLQFSNHYSSRNIYNICFYIGDCDTFTITSLLHPAASLLAHRNRFVGHRCCVIFGWQTVHLLIQPIFHILQFHFTTRGPSLSLLHVIYLFPPPPHSGIRVLVDAREKLHIPWGNADNQQYGDKLMAFDTRSAKMASGQLETSVFLDYIPAIKALWVDSGIQNAYDRRREFQLVGGRTHTHALKQPSLNHYGGSVLMRTFLYVILRTKPSTKSDKSFLTLRVATS